MLDYPELGSAKPLFRRRAYLLYPFQTRYALAVVLLTALVASVMSLVLFRLFARTGFEPMRWGAVTFEQNVRWLFLWIFLLILSSFGFFYLLVVLASHRVAGPLAVMTKYMSDFASGNYPEIRELRKSDELKEFFQLFKTVIERFRSRDLDEIEIIRTELEKLRGLQLGPAADELESSLQRLLDRRLRAVAVSSKD